ncbi:MAG: 6-carboxytetrahydropterin synthase [Pseudomonadota bacterium]
MATELTNPQTDRPALKVDGATFRISKSVTFEAAHAMPGKPDGHPYKNIHGHSFVLEACVAGRVQPGDQWVEDFAVLTEALQRAAGKLDHQMLNEIEGLDVPTLERICLWAALQLKPALPGLASVAVSRPTLNERCELILD